MKNITTFWVWVIAATALPACALNVDVPLKEDGGEGEAGDGTEDSNLDTGNDEQREGDFAGDAEPAGEGDPGWEPDMEEDIQDADAEEEEEPVCGNSVVEGTEECDDGRNGDAGDGCTDDCRYSCRGDGDCDDGLVCNGLETCDTVTTHRCMIGIPVGTGTLCEEDGIACTSDECDGAGLCVSTPSDLNCGSGALCLPACRVDDTGCVAPPSSMTLACTSPVTPPAGSSCTIDLAGLANQSACLSCSSEAGMVLLDYSDFGDDAGGCEQDGWSLVTGMSCTDSVNACTPTNPTACCDDFSTICVSTLGSYLLRSDRQLNCGGDMREWRMSKTFDTTGVGSLELCFEIGDSGATGNEGILVYISDGVRSAQVFCLNGEPQASVDGVLYPQCVTLPSWASDNPSLQVMVIAHSNDDDDVLYIDDISLKGWSPFCPPTTRTVFSESFSGCSNPIADGWNGWRVAGHPACPGSWNCSSGTSAQALAETWSIERVVDASSLDGNVTLCFSYGDNNATAASSISVEFDAGSGFRTAWFQSGKLGNNQTCRSICIDLSDIDAAVNRTPVLSVRFTFTAAGGQSLDLDDILIRGAVYCDASSVAVLGPVTETGGGAYTFTVTDPSGGRIDPDILCSWDSPPWPVSDWTSVSFVP